MRSLVRPVLKESAKQGIPLPNKRAARPDQRPPRPSGDQKRAPKQGRIASFEHGGGAFPVFRPNSTDGWHEFERVGSTSWSGLDWRVAPIQTHGWHQLDVRPRSSDESTDGWPRFGIGPSSTDGWHQFAPVRPFGPRGGTSSPTTQVGMTGGTSWEVAPVWTRPSSTDGWHRFTRWHRFTMGSTSSSGLDWRVAPIQTHGWHQLDVREVN